MKNVRKAGSVAKKQVSGSIAKAKNGKNCTAAVPFAHRTPTQLHASTYIVKRG